MGRLVAVVARGKRACRRALAHPSLPRGGRRHDACWCWDGPNPHHPAPSRVAIRRSAGHVKSGAGAAQRARATRGRKRLELEATLVQNHRTELQPAAPRRATSSPLPAGVEAEAKASMHHDPNPFDEGSADDNIFSVSPKPFSPHSEIMLPT